MFSRGKTSYMRLFLQTSRACNIGCGGKPTKVRDSYNNSTIFSDVVLRQRRKKSTMIAERATAATETPTYAGVKEQKVAQARFCLFLLLCVRRQILAESRYWRMPVRLDVDWSPSPEQPRAVYSACPICGICPASQRGFL